jgi:AraC family transcriptional regulator of adaptative response/methylated-DNA-[protein]-cysteine methyltransferase
MKIVDRYKIDQYYKALIEKNPDYLGVFFVGVKSTLVFCISTCRARKPKKENVEFYPTFKDALEEGYRPCKICKPTENATAPSQDVERAIELVRSNPKDKITDFELENKKISATAVRRWFKTHYGITFQAFQRMYRMNNAYEELQKGNNTAETAFASGYESLSGFGYTFKKIVGKSPSAAKNNKLIIINRLTTPIGPMFICATEKGICLLEFTNRKMLEREIQDLQSRLKAKIIMGENKHIVQAKNELEEYFNGKRKSFNVEVDLVGTDFQKTVWSKLKDIPFGATTSYLSQAKSLNREKSVRAVASANGYNKISIIIPCHRVIGNNGNLTGYGGGLERKKWLLDHEQKLWNE